MNYENYNDDGADGLAKRIEARTRFYRRQCDSNPIAEYLFDYDDCYDDCNS